EVAAGASIGHVEAVAAALDIMERRAGATRQMVDGERRRIPTGIAAATFVHRTSREGDPQLHTHGVVANLGRRLDGTFAALDATPLYEATNQAAGRSGSAEGPDAVVDETHGLRVISMDLARLAP